MRICSIPPDCVSLNKSTKLCCLVWCSSSEGKGSWGDLFTQRLFVSSGIGAAFISGGGKMNFL